MTAPTEPASGRRIFVIATEESGDRLGAGLIEELRQRLGSGLELAGIGGRAMAAQGVPSLFPVHELSIIGLSAVLRRLPALLRRIRQAADAVIAYRPDVLVIIDGPDFTHRVARRVRRAAPQIAIVDYVSPTVWAWRSGRARAMTRYVDHVLALLPFEPQVHRELGGPPCTYVGHPLLAQLDTLRPDVREKNRRETSPPTLVVLPGSRAGELKRLMPVFGAALGQLARMRSAFQVVLPTLPHLRPMVVDLAQDWPIQPSIVTDDAERRATFRIARAALVKSGTVTLELALAGVPMVGAYRVGEVESWIAWWVLRVPSVILANLVLGENAVPEFLQRDATAPALASALNEILDDGPKRSRQIDAFARLDAIMETGDRRPWQRAADAILALRKR